MFILKRFLLSFIFLFSLECAWGIDSDESEENSSRLSSSECDSGIDSDGSDESEESSHRLSSLAQFHSKGDPDTYTLVCLDSKRIPNKKKVNPLTKKPNFNPIRNWVSSNFLETVEREDYTDWVDVTVHETPDNKKYYSLSLYKEVKESAAEHLTDKLLKGKASR